MNWLQDFVQASVIMVLGMGVTFCFLAALIFAIRIVAKIVAKYAPTPEPVAVPRAAAPARDDRAIIAAITIAVKKYHADK